MPQNKGVALSTIPATVVGALGKAMIKGWLPASVAVQLAVVAAAAEVAAAEPVGASAVKVVRLGTRTVMAGNGTGRHPSGLSHCRRQLQQLITAGFCNQVWLLY